MATKKAPKAKAKGGEKKLPPWLQPKKETPKKKMGGSMKKGKC